MLYTYFILIEDMKKEKNKQKLKMLSVMKIDYPS